MSVIQKLENSYLGILRVVVIAAASVLLLVAIVMGVVSLKGMLPSPEPKLESVSVEPNEVLAQITPDEQKAAQAKEPQAPKGDQAKETNIHQAEYEKIFAAANIFVKKYSKNTESIRKDGFFQYLKKASSQAESDDQKARFISGLVSTIDTNLQDKRVIARVEKPAAAPAPKAIPNSSEIPNGAQNDNPYEPVQVTPVVAENPFKESPISIVGEIIDTYAKMFNQRIADAKAKQNAKVMEGMEAKANSTQQMYIAAGLFGFFMLVVFLSIIIKIERNLRGIANKP